MSETQPATTYPPVQLYNQWTDEAEDMDMSTSEWMEAMIEAGRKKFEPSDVHYDEDRTALRQDRARLQDNLAETQAQIDQLQDDLTNTDRATIIEYVNENPGATDDEIIQHLQNTLLDRVIRHLTELEGDTLRLEENRYYPREDTETNPDRRSVPR